MYNRYVRNDNGQYERTTVSHHYDTGQKDTFSDSVDETCDASHRPTQSREKGKNGILSSLLNRLKLDEIDTGDLLLLLILFLLFRESDDEELLIALGLLLIL